jgi:hypothetical protein
MNFLNTIILKSNLYSSPIASMNISQMLITVIIMIVWNHFFRLAFETHTFITSTTSNPITTISSLNRHLTTLIWTFSNSMLF